MEQAHAIITYRPLLFSIALKIVGSLQDAEDIVQDTFLKWLTIDHQKIENTKAYLIRSVTNNALTHLKRFRNHHFTDRQLDIKDQDFPDAVQEKKITVFDLDNEITEALIILNKKLEPLEKAVFVMREFFNIEYEELQYLFDKKSANCRKLFSRAKAKLNLEKSKIQVDMSPGKLVENFKHACTMGQISQLVQDFKKEISEKLP